MAFQFRKIAKYAVSTCTQVFWRNRNSTPYFISISHGTT